MTESLLYNISRRLNSDLDLHRVLADVIDLTVKHVGAANGSIMVFDERERVAHKILARADLPPEKVDTVIAQVLSQGLAGWVVERRQGDIVDDVLADERWIHFPDDDLAGGSAIGVPLLRRERVVGVLTLRHPEKGHFTAKHLALVSAIADQAAIAIENARLFHSVQAERAKLEAIINGAGDAILVVEPDGQIMLANPMARNVLGKGEAFPSHIEQIANQSLLDLWHHRDDSARPSASEVTLPDGRTFHATINRVAQVGFVIVMQDITYLKELDRMRNEFVSAISHDLRSPLQLICTYAVLLSETPDMDPQQKKFLDGINRGVQKMSDLIDALLELARIRAGVGMVTEPCDLGEIAAQVVARFREAALDKGLELENTCPPHLPPVEANEARLDQVLSNLVDNALKYTFEGQVTVSAQADEQWVTVYVSDTGVGLLPEEQKNLFHKFYRAKNKQTAHVEGTGLGLTIAKSIVEQYGGKIWVKSRWQEGSTFAFSLPRSGQE